MKPSRATSLSLLCTLGLLLTPALTPVTVARADRAIIAGQEAHVLALFAPTELGGEIAPGRRLVNVAIGTNDITVTLVAADASPLTLRLAARDAASATGVRILETESFQVLSEEALEGAALEAARAFGERVRSNDDGSFWAEVTAEVSEGTGSDEDGTRSNAQVRWWPAVRLALAAAAIALLLVVLGSWFRRRVKKKPGPETVPETAPETETETGPGTEP